VAVSRARPTRDRVVPVGCLAEPGDAARAGVGIVAVPDDDREVVEELAREDAFRAGGWPAG
jgi:hypothetical protein